MSTNQDALEVADDVCALPLARRLAALLDRDPSTLRNGDPLPRGWHVLLFNTPTTQSRLRNDGAAGLGVTLPELGLPRLMLGGRQIRFSGDIAIGTSVRRESRQQGVEMKEGRSGRFALVKVEHRIFVANAAEAAVVEVQDYVLRAASPAAPSSAARNAAAQDSASASAAATARAAGAVEPDVKRTIVPDEPMLFRYSAITDNPHRIHYDQPYATGAEGYPALVVNGSIPAMFLLELYRSHAGREPAAFSSRNVAPMFCGRPLLLNALNEGASWRLWAQDEQGNTTFDARAE